MARAARLLTRTSLLLSALAGAIAGCGGSSGESDAGGGSDAPIDASIDTNHDAAPQCHGDLDCNDGLYCNGDEHCTAGVCVAGTAPACSDSVACTHDFCSEDRRACVHQVPDVDMDGHGDAACIDGTGVPLGDDCADDDANRFPSNTEVCDTAGHDEDCSDATHGHVDHDSDGFEDALCCNGTNCGDDCDDSNRSVNPSATEVCDHIDNDCNTMIDEGVGVAMYPDADRDGYGDSSMATTTQCGDTVGYAAAGGDCADDRVDRNPGQLEVCDSVDNDCDTTVDEDTGNVPWYVDADHDGYGDAHGATLVQCAPPTGFYSLVGTDCDDTTSSRSPRAPEVCNAVDDDCNGLADFAITPGDLEDDDHDGIADIGCGLPRGLDCNDRDATALPGAPEICNGRDDDCDAHVDEDATSATFHRDADGDGFGDPGTAVIACFAPMGYVTDASDCDDSTSGSARHPGATEICNASDDDCDRHVDETPAASSCTIPGAITACTVGICHSVGCQPGLSDCTLAEGCETSTLAADDNCGGCGVLCDPQFSNCAQSRCVPGGLAGVAGVSPRDDVGTSVAMNGPTIVIGGTFAGTGFGVGCGTHYDAVGIAGIVGLRDSSGRCLTSRAIDGSGDEIVTGVSIDGAGNVYAVLTTTSSTLSIGTIAVNVGAGQGGRDVVVLAMDSALVPRWARRFGGTFDDTLTDVVVDGTDVWAVGAMRGPVTLDSSMLATTTTTDSVAVHLSTTDGSVLHFASAPSTGMDGALGVAIDTSSVYVVGTVSGSATFGATAITASGPSDGYAWVLARADASTTLARAFGGTGTDIVTGVAVSTGTGPALALSGAFEGTITIDGTTAPSAGLRDGFVVGLDAALVAQWLVRFGGTGDDVLNDVGYSPLTTSPHFVVAGTYSGSGVVSGSDGGVTSAGGTDGVTFAIDSSGFVSALSSIGGTGRDDAYRVACDPTFRVVVAGDYTGTFSWAGQSFPGVGGLDAFWIVTAGGA